MSIDTLFNSIVDEFSEDRIPGWCPLEKAHDLAATVVALRPKVVVEIGVYGGKSLLPMAMACQAIDCGVVIGIDPWSPVASAEGYTGENAKWWARLDHEGIYRSFVDNINRLGLQNRVAVERAKSDDAAVPDSIDLLHVDGQHSEQAIRDVRKYGARIRVGGLAVLDDIHWVNDGVAHVALAVKELLNSGFTELYHVYTATASWGVFQRTAVPAAKAKRKSKR